MGQLRFLLLTTIFLNLWTGFGTNSLSKTLAQDSKASSEDFLPETILPIDTAVLVEVDSVSKTWSAMERFCIQHKLKKKTEIVPIPAGIYFPGGVAASGTPSPRTPVRWPLQLYTDERSMFLLDSDFFESASSEFDNKIDFDKKIDAVSFRESNLDSKAFFSVVKVRGKFSTVIGLEVGTNADAFEVLLTRCTDLTPIPSKQQLYRNFEIHEVGDSTSFFFFNNHWLFATPSAEVALQLMDNLIAQEAGLPTETLSQSRLFRRLVDAEDTREQHLFGYIDNRLSQDFIHTTWENRFPRDKFLYGKVKTNLAPIQLACTFSLSIPEDGKSLQGAWVKRAFTIPTEDQSVLFLKNPKSINLKLPEQLPGNPTSVIVVGQLNNGATLDLAQLTRNQLEISPGISFSTIVGGRQVLTGTAWPSKTTSKFDKWFDVPEWDKKNTTRYVMEADNWRYFVYGNAEEIDGLTRQAQKEPNVINMEVINRRIGKTGNHGELIFAEASCPSYNQFYEYLTWHDHVPLMGLLGFPPSRTFEAVREIVYAEGKDGRKLKKFKITGKTPSKYELSGIPNSELSWFDDLWFRLRFQMLVNANSLGFESDRPFYAFGYAKPNNGILTTEILIEGEE